MNNRTTPETDAEHQQFAMGGFTLDFCRKLERERDEAREKWKEQNEALRTLAEHGENEIQKLIKECDEARNKMADALQEVDLRTLDFERMKQERDEAREEVASLRLEAKYHDEADALRKLRERERNEARDKAERYRLEANAMMLQRDEAQNKLRLEKLTIISQKEEIELLRQQLIEARNK